MAIIDQQKDNSSAIFNLSWHLWLLSLLLKLHTSFKVEEFVSLSIGLPRNFTMDSDHSKNFLLYLLDEFQKRFFFFSFSWFRHSKRWTLTHWLRIKPIKWGKERQGGMICPSAFPGPLPSAKPEPLGRIALGKKNHDHYHPWVMQSRQQEGWWRGELWQVAYWAFLGSLWARFVHRVEPFVYMTASVRWGCWEQLSSWVWDWIKDFSILTIILSFIFIML